jgi:hypothetical protein
MNLSRFAGVSEAGACRRNPERSEGSLNVSSWLGVGQEDRFELEDIFRHAGT